VILRVEYSHYNPACLHVFQAHPGVFSALDNEDGLEQAFSNYERQF
jgi:hypothetical protein